MIDFEVKGAVFDLDDTLFENESGQTALSPHGRSRLAAIHEVGKIHGMLELAELSMEDNLSAFENSPVHSVTAAVWNILWLAGVTDTVEVDREHPLLKEILSLKEDFHELIVLDEGREVPGAHDFVRKLALGDVEERLAIASSSARRHVDLALGKIGLNELFLPHRIKSRESVLYTKPHPEVYDRAFLSLDLPEKYRRNVYAFDDDPKGLLAARAAGLYACGIATRFSIQELKELANPDLAANSHQEFAEHFGFSLTD